ncbi:MAP7 domain-containing protein 1 isoform X2 [Frankliniella occidentalis]|uniref:MAP7 domain-containing protein 1 isoform X2 n=1 Tax=Frankliniella occidentalis TaxID=133901 RepID=A0A6J1S0K9_FRAOC|nr:MAP7 domain-containing protein 1 isoform X2 [Frankliniella occidentalis]
MGLGPDPLDSPLAAPSPPPGGSGPPQAHAPSGPTPPPRHIPHSTLDRIRGILVSSLPRENLGTHDDGLHVDDDDDDDDYLLGPPPVAPARRVTFRDTIAGATSDALNQRPGSATGGKPLAAKPGRRDPNSQTLHWFAHVGPDGDKQNIQVAVQEQANHNALPGGKENAALQREREERLRVLRDKQNEERQRKLEELKQQALAAQKFREQKEEERRRRIEDMRQRDGDRRHQVEERKRQIIEAEQERRTAILRKNQEREARIEMKRKNERSSIVFAFGSSTPRMLEPADTGGSYWATRRATSTTTLFSGAPLTLTRRGSERELDGSKKRATSASGLDRKPGVPGGAVTGLPHHHDDDQGAVSPDGVGSGYMTPRSATAARRKTDLIPTIPSPREGRDQGPPSSRQSRRPSGNAPNRAYSMSRLDQLSQPRKLLLPRPGAASPGAGPAAPERPERRRAGGGAGAKGTLSSAKSMGHLAGGRLSVAGAGAGPSAGGSRSAALARTDTSRSMTQLCVSSLSSLSPVPPPRMTRAERLRRRAREQAVKSQPLDTGTAGQALQAQPAQQQGLRSGETTPSRPLSAMSQQSMSSVSSSIGAPMRSKPVAAPRRPRPASIAVTGVTVDPPPRHSLSSEHKRQAAASAAAAVVTNGAGEKPPVPRHGSSSRKTSSDRMSASMYGAIPCSDSTSNPPKKPPKTVKASPRPTPKATPLQSPRTDNAPTLPQDSTPNQTKAPEPPLKAAPLSNDSVPIPAPSLVSLPVATTIQTSLAPTEMSTVQVQEASTPVPEPSAQSMLSAELTFHQMEQQHQEQIWEAQRQIDVSPVSAISAPISNDTSLSEAVDMTASMIAKQRITTEEEAKAALAERRRLAREQAEREAELERQRLEAERLAEEERLRQEEEEQRRFEEEQERLAAEARKSEEQRLLQAIQEAQKREEEERKRREEEAQQKAEKEEAEKKAKEEAEKQRKEMELKLKREEEERMERRKRVEAIMLRTRGKGTTPTSTPTRENGDLNQIENEEPQPAETIEDTKSVTSATTSSQSNGHSNGVDSIKQNNAANVLLDLSEHNSVSSSDLLGPLANEDCINSNINANNGLSNGPPPLIAAFNDSTLSKKQDSNVVTDLLS